MFCIVNRYSVSVPKRFDFCVPVFMYSIGSRLSCSLYRKWELIYLAYKVPWPSSHWCSFVGGILQCWRLGITFHMALHTWATIKGLSAWARIRWSGAHFQAPSVADHTWLMRTAHSGRIDFLFEVIDSQLQPPRLTPNAHSNQSVFELCLNWGI